MEKVYVSYIQELDKNRMKVVLFHANDFTTSEIREIIENAFEKEKPINRTDEQN